MKFIPHSGNESVVISYGIVEANIQQQYRFVKIY